MSEQGYEHAGHLMWSGRGNAGDVWRCDRCRGLTDDRDGHSASHMIEDARLLRVIEQVMRDQLSPGAWAPVEPRPSKVATWLDTAQVGKGHEPEYRAQHPRPRRSS